MVWRLSLSPESSTDAAGWFIQFGKQGYHPSFRMHAGHHVLSHHHLCRHPFSRHGGRHAARWPAGHATEMTSFEAYKMWQCISDSPQSYYRDNSRKRALWKKYGIVLTHTLYCSHENVEFHFSAAVCGGTDLLIDFHCYCLAKLFKRPSVTWVWCRNICSFRWWAWKANYWLLTLRNLPLKFVAELMEHPVCTGLAYIGGRIVLPG